uniref:Uncharacterized protein n=1 Tax=Arundo donax TaxID=35708 RepID=A0A0A8Z3A6_ARUDO
MKKSPTIHVSICADPHLQTRRWPQGCPIT